MQPVGPMCPGSSILPSRQGGGQEHEHQFQFCCLLPMWFGDCYFSLLSLSFLICKVGIITNSVSWGRWGSR